MKPPGPLSIEAHRERSAYHLRAGDNLAEAGEEGWAAVCYFYAAYHLIRASLINDPVFDDPTMLSRVRPELAPEDRNTSRHNGRKKTMNGREWGVNELVSLLYKPLVKDYERLHQASIDVRYNAGLRGGLAPLRESLRVIQAAYEAGDIAAALPPDRRDRGE